MAGYDTRSAERLAATIGGLKWLFLLLIALVVVVATVVVAVSSGSGEMGGSEALMVLAATWLYGLIAAVSIYVLWGWFEHTLHMLTRIVRNTGPR